MAKLLVYILLLFGLASQAQGVQLLSFEHSECSHDPNHNAIIDRIISNGKDGEHTVIQIGVITNCCNWYGDVNQQGDTINLIAHGKRFAQYNDAGDSTGYAEELCDCNCCYTYTFTLSGNLPDSSVICFNGTVISLSEHKYALKPVRFELSGTDTINYYDLYGFRQGRHVEYNEAGAVIIDMTYSNNQPFTGLLRRRFKDGKIWYERFMKDGEHCKEVTYHENGQMKSSCKVKSEFDENPSCIDYDENGQEIPPRE